MSSMDNYGTERPDLHAGGQKIISHICNTTSIKYITQIFYVDYVAIVAD